MISCPLMPQNTPFIPPPQKNSHLDGLSRPGLGHCFSGSGRADTLSHQMCKYMAISYFTVLQI